MNNAILKEDLLNIAQKIKNLKITNKTIVISGASGTLGSFLINSILLSNELYHCKNKIIAFTQNKNSTSQLFKKDASLRFKNYNDYIESKIDFVVHFACPTNSKFFVDLPVKTVSTIYNLTTKFLDLAKRNNVKFLYISSMEVYGKINDRKIKTEEELGVININNSRSSYPFGKKIGEALTNFYFYEFGTNINIARLAQTFGAGSKLNDTRLFNYAAQAALKNKTINLATDGESYGNYIYLSDAISAILHILIKGETGETYNVCIDNSSVKIKDFCQLISQGKVDIVLNKGKNYFFNNTQLNMSSKKIKKIGWRNQYNLKQSINRYIMYLKG